MKLHGANASPIVESAIAPSQNTELAVPPIPKRFNVLTLGDAGPTLVFVHGVMIDNLSSFYLSIAPALAKAARVILYDLRGHGRSEQPPSGYTTDDMADDLDGILAALDLPDPRVIVVGHSFGGYIALRCQQFRHLAFVLFAPQQLVVSHVNQFDAAVLGLRRRTSPWPTQTGHRRFLRCE